MASFLASVPGVVSAAGLVALYVAGRRRRRRLPTVTPADSRVMMQMAVSGVVLVAGLWVILTGRYDADAQKWAAGVVGTVAGYWLK